MAKYRLTLTPNVYRDYLRWEFGDDSPAAKRDLPRIFVTVGPDDSFLYTVRWNGRRAWTLKRARSYARRIQIGAAHTQGRDDRPLETGALRIERQTGRTWTLVELV